MTNANIVDRLAALPNLAKIPHAELVWLGAHGRLETYPAGAVVAEMGKRIEQLWIILSGRISVRIDRGTGPRRVITWGSGEVSGMLPFSRMTGPPGHNYLEEPGELLMVAERHFPEMIRECPAFTAYTVHLMLDRARGFNTSDLQDEKMISLGKLAAGLAHELNNPASAVVRDARFLLGSLAEVDASRHALMAAGLTGELLDTVERIRSDCQAPAHDDLPPLQRAEREDEIADWLTGRRLGPALAGPLADARLTVEKLEGLARAMPAASLEPALRWIAATCGERALAHGISRAATRIYDLVAAVKRFTYMDTLAGSESVDVETGLRDTLQVLASKVGSKRAAVTFDIEPALAPARAVGGELNQVWFNVIDNALDAIPEGGHIVVTARREVDRIVVSIVDDGPGIAPEILPHVFDPFFTTKPPGQGTGLGLDTARRLLRRHHGEIEATSVPGRTEFRISLLVERPRTAAP